MADKKLQTEKVSLPSKGLLYSDDSPLRDGTIEVKYMTAKEEDILTNQSFIKSGIVIDKLLEALVVSPINFTDLLIGDKNAILVAARVYGYGPHYVFNYTNPKTQAEEEVMIDLSLIEDKELDESLLTTKGLNEFNFTLPRSEKVVTFKLLTQKDENNIQSELKTQRKLRMSPDVDLTFNFEGEDGTTVSDVQIPIGVGFFWPDLQL